MSLIKLVGGILATSALAWNVFTNSGCRTEEVILQTQPQKQTQQDLQTKIGVQTKSQKEKKLPELPEDIKKYLKGIRKDYEEITSLKNILGEQIFSSERAIELLKKGVSVKRVKELTEWYTDASYPFYSCHPFQEFNHDRDLWDNTLDIFCSDISVEKIKKRYEEIRDQLKEEIYRNGEKFGDFYSTTDSILSLILTVPLDFIKELSELKGRVDGTYGATGSIVGPQDYYFLYRTEKSAEDIKNYIKQIPNYDLPSVNRDLKYGERNPITCFILNNVPIEFVKEHFGDTIAENGLTVSFAWKIVKEYEKLSKN